MDDLSSDLSLRGIVVQSLHGDREQCDREEALQDFRDGMGEGGDAEKMRSWQVDREGNGQYGHILYLLYLLW